MPQEAAVIELAVDCVKCRGEEESVCILLLSLQKARSKRSTSLTKYKLVYVTISMNTYL